MLPDLTILAEGDFDARGLFAVAVVVVMIIFSVIGKLKEQADEAERRRRLSSAPPPVNDRVPPVPQLPTATPWPPVVTHGPGQPRRQVERPRPSGDVETEQRRQARRQRLAREAARAAEAVRGTQSGQAATGLQQELGGLQRQTESEVRGQFGEIQPVESLAQLLSRKPKAAPSAVDAAAFGKLTVDELRRAIVLNEILNPPLAMREDQ